VISAVKFLFSFSVSSCICLLDTMYRIDSDWSFKDLVNTTASWGLSSLAFSSFHAWYYKNPDLGHILAKFKKKSVNVIENVLLRVLNMCFDGAYVFVWKKILVKLHEIYFVYFSGLFFWERKLPTCTLEKNHSSIYIQFLLLVRFIHIANQIREMLGTT
jgi:hypothetical protein